MTEEDADNYCLICGEDFSESTEEEIEKCVQCKQRYHAHCINRWCDEGEVPGLYGKRGCPYCRDRRICISDIHMEINLAIRSNKPIDYLQYLVDNGANVNYKIPTDITPLHIVCGTHTDRVDYAKFLVDNGAKFYIDGEGDTFFHMFSSTNNLKIANFFIDYIKEKNTILIEEEEYDLMKIFNLRNNFGVTPLHISSFSNKPEMVSLLIENNADINDQDVNGLTPLHTALINKAYESALILNSANNNLDNSLTSEGDTILHTCIMAGYSDLFTAFLSKGADINKQNDDGETPILYAIKAGNLDFCKSLIDNGADINTPTKDGSTPIHYAAIEEHTSILQLLLNNDVKVNVKDEDGETPLHLAANSGSKEVLKLLLSYYKDNIDVVTNDNRTPLHYAALSAKEDNIAILLNAGVIYDPFNPEETITVKANVNAIDFRGDTPLHCAVRVNCRRCVSQLIENAADIFIANQNNETAFDLSEIVIRKTKERLLAANAALVSLESTNTSGFSEEELQTHLNSITRFQIDSNNAENLHYIAVNIHNVLQISNLRNRLESAHLASDASNAAATSFDSDNERNSDSESDSDSESNSESESENEEIRRRLMLTTVLRRFGEDWESEPAFPLLSRENLERMPLHILREIRDLYQRLSERAQNMIVSEIPVTAQQREELEQRNEVESLPERLLAIEREVNTEVEQLIDNVSRAQDWRNNMNTPASQEERLAEGDSAASSDNQSGGNKEECKKHIGGTNSLEELEDIDSSQHSVNSANSIRSAFQHNRYFKNIERQLQQKKQERLGKKMMERLYYYKSIHFREPQILDSPSESEDEELINILNSRMQRLGISNYSLYNDIKESLDAGANPDYIEEWNMNGNKTPLILAVEEGWYHIVKILLKYGADPNIVVQSFHGVKRTALSQAIKKGRYEIVLLLIKNGVNVNFVEDSTNLTPLQVAILERNKDIVELLLKNGASPHGTDREGNTILDMAPLLAKYWYENNSRELSRSDMNNQEAVMKIFDDYYAQKAVDKGMVAEVGAMYKVKLPANISGEYGANVEDTDFKDGVIQKFLGGMKPEDLTPEKLKELEPYLSTNLENSLYEYLDIFDKKHPRFYCKSVESKLDELEKWMIHTLLRLQDGFPFASFYIGGRVIPNTPLRRDIHFTTDLEDQEEDVNETELHTQEDIKKFIRFFKKQSSNEILKLFNMFVLSNPILHHHTGTDRYIILDIPVIYNYYLFEHIVGNNRVIRAYDRENSNNYRFGIGGLVTIDSTAVPHLGLDPTMVEREIDAHEELRLNIKAFQKKIIRICSYNAIEKSRKRFEDESDNLLLDKEEEKMLWATVYDVEFFKHIENGMNESDADEEALKEANLVIANKNKDYGPDLVNLFNEIELDEVER